MTGYIRRRLALGLAATALALGGMGLVADPTRAHYQVNGYQKPIQDRFYFQGYTYGKEDGKYTRSDPLNLTFLSWPPDYLAADEGSVKTAFYEYWKVGSSGNRMADSSKCFLGSSTQYLRFRGFRSYNGAEGDERPSANYQMANGSAKSIRACGNEFHIRWWNDADHYALTNRSGTRDRHIRRDEWALGGAHHEDRSGVKAHHIDRDWFTVTNQVYGRMSNYCRFRRYLHDPRSEGLFQKKDSDGYIMAITFQTQRPCSVPKIR